MIEIKIDQFTGYDASAFFEYLKMDRSIKVRIYLPRAAVLFENEPDELSLEYACLAFVGQKISAVDIGFFMEFPPMDQRTDFVFEVKTQKKKELSALLAWLAKAYADGRDAFYGEVESFMRQANGRALACPEYYYLALQFWLMYRVQRQQFGE